MKWLLLLVVGVAAASALEEAGSRTSVGGEQSDLSDDVSLLQTRLEAVSPASRAAAARVELLQLLRERGGSGSGGTWAIAIVVVLVSSTALLRLLRFTAPVAWWPSASKEAGCLPSAVAAVQCAYSMLLLAFSVAVVMSLIFQGKTGMVSSGLPKVAAFFMFWLLIVWLAVAEGGQCALVGLQPVDPRRYEESHHTTSRSVSVVSQGGALERFIVGRQLLVTLVVFIISECCTAEPGAGILGLPASLSAMFVTSNLCLLVTTVLLGQLVGQVSAATCMLDYANGFVLLLTVYGSLMVEFSGLLHCVHLVNRLIDCLGGGKRREEEPPRSLLERSFFWLRVALSMAVLGYAVAVTIDLLCRGWTSAHGWGPPWVLIAVYLALLCFLGLLEGLQIALFAVVKMDASDYKDSHGRAHAHVQLACAPGELQALLVGRQILVTLCMLVLARIGTPERGLMGKHDSSLGAGRHLQGLIDTGLMGAFVATTVGALAWRVVASARPLGFLSNPLLGPIIYLCFCIEATGIMSASGALSKLLRALLRLRPDDEHLGRSSPAAEPPHDRGVH